MKTPPPFDRVDYCTCCNPPRRLAPVPAGCDQGDDGQPLPPEVIAAWRHNPDGPYPGYTGM